MLEGIRILEHRELRAVKRKIYSVKRHIRRRGSDKIRNKKRRASQKTKLDAAIAKRMPSKITPVILGRCYQCFRFKGLCHGFTIEKTAQGWNCLVCARPHGGFKCRPVSQEEIDANIDKARKIVGNRIRDELRQSHPDLFQNKGKQTTPKFDSISAAQRDQLRSLREQGKTFDQIAEKLPFRGATFWRLYYRTHMEK